MTNTYYEHEINKLPNNFIGAWLPKNTSVCDDLINYHKKSKQKHDGISSGKVDKSIKNSTDVLLIDDTISIKYFNDILNPITQLYILKYNQCNNYNPWKVVEGINIQHYKPTEGYYQWHTERTSNTSPINNRHLVFMTYLNDVTDGGETEFLYQNIKIKPKKGLTLIWPVDWTHTHRGITSKTQEKYIITGWYSFIDKKD
jgi:hypothetical protein